MKRIITLLITMSLAFAISGCKVYKNEWVIEWGRRYYYDEYGKKVTDGWVEYNGDWYCLDYTGAMLTDQFIGSEGHVYYVDYDGKMLTNTTKSIRGDQYSFDSSGNAIKIDPYQLVVDCQFPKVFRSGSNRYSWSEVVIENITHTMRHYQHYSGKDYYYFQLKFSGIAGNSSGGINYSISRRVGWKLYDPKKYVISSGVFDTRVSLMTGESFRDIEMTIGEFSELLKEKGVYRLALMDAEY